MRRIQKGLIIFLLGGTIYALLEVVFKGATHWTMLLTGGTVFALLYLLFRAIGSGRILRKCLLGGLVITTAEYIVGAIVNLGLHMSVWDYSARPHNLFGQICLQFSAGWVLLSLPAALLAFALRLRLQ